MSSTTVTPSEPQVQTPPATPAPPAEPQPYTITKAEDGTFNIKLETGEVFAGNADDVLAKLAKSKIDTNNSYKGIKQEMQSLRQQFEPIATALQPKAPQPSQEELEQAKLDEFLAERQAKFLGFQSASEMRDAVSGMRQMTQQQSQQMELANFHAQAPDFPGTPEASDKLIETAIKHGLVPTKQNPDGTVSVIGNPSAGVLLAAHAAAIYEGAYKPLTAEQIAQQRQASLPQTVQRPAAPPVLPGTQPELSTAVNPNDVRALWSMKPDELKKLVSVDELKRMGMR